MVSVLFDPCFQKCFEAIKGEIPLSKKILLLLSLLCVIAVTAGCGRKGKTKITAAPAESETQAASADSSSTSSGATVSEIFDQNAVQSEMMKAANAYQDIYKAIDTKEYFNVTATKAQRQQIVARIGNLGYTVVSDNIDMQNPDAVKQFWEKSKEGQDAELAIYEVELDASLERYTLKLTQGKTYFTCVTATWNAADQPQIQYGNVEIIDKFELTTKGYFLYHIPAQNGLWDNSHGFRITPLPVRNRELCEKYIKPVGYQGNNILTSNWDQKTITKLNFNDMFEYVYRLDYQKEPASDQYARYYPDKVNTLAVPASDFEGILTKYFQISAKELRETAVYDPSRRVYAWQSFCGPQYEPTPVVVAYRTNKDGSLTLTVDAVAIAYYSDCDFTDIVTIMPHKDGSFKYLSNSVTIYDNERFPAYSPRIRKSGG